MVITQAQSKASVTNHTNGTNENSFHRGPALPPEVLHIILQKLPLSSVMECAQVSREFNRIATPLLWRVHASPKIRSQMRSPAYLQSLVKNAHHIRICRIRYKELLDIFSPDLHGSPQQLIVPVMHPNIQELSIGLYENRTNRYSPANDACFLNRIKTSVSLCSIRIQDCISPELAIAIAHSQQTRLTDITLSTNLSVAGATFFFSKLSPHVQSLKLKNIQSSLPEIIYEDERPFTTNHHALRSLHLGCSCDRDAFDLFLVPFLATCTSNLKSCHVGNRLSRINLNVCVALENLGIHEKMFTETHLENAQPGDEEIASKVRVFTHLEKVIIPNFKNVGPRTIVTILALTETLQELDLPNYGCITSTDVILMLSSLQRLESIKIQGPWFLLDHDNGFYPSCNLFLTAAEVLSIEWATKSLKCFVCPILVPRPESHVPEEYRVADLTCEEEEESWAIQRRVYQRLAEQSNLTSLYFSVHMGLSKYKQQWYSLEMTLKSGIDELKRLRELGILSITGLNHNMEAQDFQWMKETWSENTLHNERCTLT